MPTSLFAPVQVAQRISAFADLPLVLLTGVFSVLYWSLLSAVPEAVRAGVLQKAVKRRFRAVASLPRQQLSPVAGQPNEQPPAIPPPATQQPRNISMRPITTPQMLRMVDGRGGGTGAAAASSRPERQGEEQVIDYIRTFMFLQHQLF